MTKRAKKETSVIRVLIADHYPFFRRGLRAFVEEQPDVAVLGEAAAPDELLRLCQELRPSILLLGMNLAGSDGVVLVGSLHRQFPDIGLILFMAPDDEEALPGCIASGARGCIMKNADPPVVLSAIRTVSSGGYWLQREMTAKVFREVRRGVQAERERVRASLTNRENEVLKLVADGLRNSDIGRRLFISERTVKIHVANIFNKLRVHDRVQATRYAIRNGLVPA